VGDEDDEQGCATCRISPPSVEQQQIEHDHVLNRIGEGGTGEVYRATRLNRKETRSDLNGKGRPSMTTILRKALAVVSLVALLLAPASSYAWGYTGHEAVACVAWQQLTPATRARVLVLLQMVPPLHNPNGTDTITG
jgi:hypothetical protein